MNDISNNAYLSSLSLETRQQEEAGTNAAEDTNELGQTAFLELMITQMENQDPLSPQDNSEFVAQLAHFSSVEGLEKLNTNFDSFTSSFLSNQALEASSLVGSQVAVAGNEAILLEGSFIGGSIDVPSTTSDMTMNIYSESGTLAHSIPMGAQEGGEVVFRWSGNQIEINGELSDWQPNEDATPGDYTVEVLATQDGELQALETALTANVNSVTVSESGDLTLNLAGRGAVSINDVKQFN